MLFLCRRSYILHAILFGNFVWIFTSIAIDSNLIAGSIKHFLKKEHNIQGLQSLSNLIPDLFSDSKTIHARQDLLFVYHDGVTDKSVALNCSEHCHRLVTVMLIVDSYHRDKKKNSVYMLGLFLCISQIKSFTLVSFWGNSMKLEHTVLDRRPMALEHVLLY